jgi:hypothetical protein
VFYQERSLVTVHSGETAYDALLHIAANGLGLADVPALAFRQPKFIDKVE